MSYVPTSHYKILFTLSKCLTMSMFYHSCRMSLFIVPGCNHALFFIRLTFFLSLTKLSTGRATSSQCIHAYQAVSTLSQRDLFCYHQLSVYNPNGNSLGLLPGGFLKIFPHHYPWEFALPLSSIQLLIS